MNHPTGTQGGKHGNTPACFTTQQWGISSEELAEPIDSTHRSLQKTFWLPNHDLFAIPHSNGQVCTPSAYMID